MLNPKLKINYVVESFPQPSETFVITPIVACIKEGLQVSILTERTLPFENSSQLNVLTKYDLKNRLITSPNYNFNYFKRFVNAFLFALNFKIKGVTFLFRSMFQFNNGIEAINLRSFYLTARFLELKKETKQIFHAQFGPCGVIVINARKMGIIKGALVTTFHGYDAHFNKKSINEVRRNYEDLFHYGEVFTVNSNYLKGQLLQLNCDPNKIRIIPIGVDTNFFVPSKSNKSFDLIKIVSIGRLISLKGHIYGVKAVKKLIDKGYNVSYTIIGSGEEKENLENEIRKNKLENVIKLTGNKSQIEILKILQNSHLFYMTSIADENGRQETQGVVSAEAQSCGLPVLAFDSGGISETLVNNQTGFLIKERNYNELSALTEKLINDLSMYEEFSSNARHYVVEKFCLKKMNEAYINIYRELNAK